MSLKKPSRTRQLFISEAKSRGWTYRPLPANIGHFFRPGDENPIVVSATLTEVTSPVSIKVLQDKSLLPELLEELEISHPRSLIFDCNSVVEAEKFIAEVGAAVIKPAQTSQGKGAVMQVDTMARLNKAIKAAAPVGAPQKLIAQQDISSLDEYRIGYYNGKVAGVLKVGRTQLIGDGRTSLADLLKQKFSEVEHRYFYEHDLSREMLESSYSLVLGDDEQAIVLAEGDVKLIKNPIAFMKGANTPIALTDLDESIKIFVSNMCRSLGVEIAGIDIFLEDHTKPIKEQRYYVTEINAGPGIGSFENPNEVIKDIFDRIERKRV